MGKLKTERAEFKTSKSVQEIANILRQASYQMKADVEQIGNNDPLGGFGEQPDLAVAFSGRLGLLGGLKHFRGNAANDIWGVQIYVYDTGNERGVELVALGEGSALGMFGGGLNLGASREHMEKLLNMLR